MPAELAYHIYRAYFTGGPYWEEFWLLPDPLQYGIGDLVDINWQGSEGVDSTTLVDIYIDRHNGNTGYPELIADDVPQRESWGFYTWSVSGPLSDSCRLKLIARDVAANTTTAYSEAMFKVLPCSWVVGDADGSTVVDISDAVYLIQHVFAGGRLPCPIRLVPGMRIAAVSWIFRTPYT